MSRSAILKNKNKTFSFFLPKPGDCTSPVGRGICMMREIERITRIVIEAYKRVRKKRALWKINWAILSRVLKFTRGRRKEIPSVYTVNKYHFFVRVDGKLYEFLIVYDKVFVYKYKEVDRFATVIR